jgi:uncharacterized protein (DUF2461 family)
MLKFFPIFRNNSAHLVEKMMFKTNKDYPLSKFERFEHATKKKIVSSIEHVNFAINKKYSKTIYDNPNYYVSHVIYQTYKNVILRNVHSLE